MEKNKSIYFVPMYNSQYIYVCTSDEPIDAEKLKGCNSKEDILKIGQSLSPSFRAVSGGKVKADDPLLGTVNSYVAEDKEAKKKMSEFTKSQINQIRELKKQEKKAYELKVDTLEEIEINIELSKGNPPLDAEEKEIEDKNQEELRRVNAEIASLDEQISNYCEAFRTCSQKIEDKKNAELEKHGLDKDINENVANYIVRKPINERMAIVCECNSQIDLSGFNGLSKDQMVEAAREMDPSFTVRGGVMYKNEDAAKPEKTDMYVKLDPNTEKRNKIIAEADNVLKKVIDTYLPKIEQFNKDKKAKIIEKATIEAKLLTKKEELITGLSDKEIDDLFFEMKDLMRATANLHEKKMDFYNNLEEKVIDAAFEDLLENGIVIEEPYLEETRTNNAEITDLRNRASEHINLSNDIKNATFKEAEVAPKIEIPVETVPEVNVEFEVEEEKIEILPEEELVINGGNKIPIRSGDDIIGYLDNDEINKPKEVKEEPKDTRVRISYGDEVHYLEDLKTQIEDKKKEFNPEEVDFEITSSKGGK